MPSRPEFLEYFSLQNPTPLRDKKVDPPSFNNVQVSFTSWRDIISPLFCLFRSIFFSIFSLFRVDKKTDKQKNQQEIIHEVEKEDSDYDEERCNEYKDIDQKRNKYFRDLFSEFDIYLAQRDFENAVELLLRTKTLPSNTTSSMNNYKSLDSINELICKQKESELINMLRKDLNISKERGNKGIMKTGKRVVMSLVKLRIYDEALSLFIDYHKTINSEALKKIKLEESNQIYMNNVLVTFFDNLKISYFAFKEAFQQIVNYSLRFEIFRLVLLILKLLKRQ